LTLAPQAVTGEGDAARRLTTPAGDPLVERGRVLALAGNCYSCHTADVRKPFAGGVAFHTDFGTIYSTNISTHRRSGIGAWTEAEFERAMRSGIGRDGQHLYPAFPYTSFTKLTDRDVKALFAFMRTLEPVASEPLRNSLKFPLNIRGSLSGWKLFFFDEGRFRPTPGLTGEQVRGEYLTEALAHCGACHTPRNRLGAERRELAYAGGRIYHRVASGDVRAWGAPNLTADPAGLRNWTARELHHYLKSGYSTKAVLMGPMNDVVLNSTRHLPEPELRAMVAYLKALPARSVDPGPRPDAAQMRRGELLYVANCGSCHTLNGAGDPKTAPSLQRSAQVQAPDPSSLLNIILYGPDVSPALLLPISRPDMPAFAAKLDDKAIADLTTFLRNSFGNRAGVVTPEQVGRQR
jgi:mono/diheme cytochrome c family protein